MPITRPLVNYVITDPRRYDMGALATHEKLWIWRHRQINTKGRLFGRTGASLSQAEASKILGIRKSAYTKFESGRNTILSVDDIDRVTQLVIYPLDREPPTLAELCILARRRAGYTLYRVAADMEMTRMNYLNLEKKGEERVIAYWMREGFRFPTIAQLARPWEKAWDDMHRLEEHERAVVMA